VEEEGGGRTKIIMILKHQNPRSVFLSSLDPRYLLNPIPFLNRFRCLLSSLFDYTRGTFAHISTTVPLLNSVQSTSRPTGRSVYGQRIHTNEIQLNDRSTMEYSTARTTQIRTNIINTYIYLPQWMAPSPPDRSRLACYRWISAYL
jgi:hypothetical protein